MIKLSEIMNSYSRPKIGELSINERALAEYERFCLELINENKNQKEVIDKLEFIKKRKSQGCSQENINKMAVELVNDWLKEVSE